MSDLNCASFSGYLRADSALSHTPEGNPCLGFTITNRTGFGNWKRTNWIDCLMFGDRSKKLECYLKKGSAVIVTGELIQESYRDERSGLTRYRFELKVRSLSFQRGKRFEENHEPSVVIIEPMSREDAEQLDRLDDTPR